jgi:hypothetical protein
MTAAAAALAVALGRRAGPATLDGLARTTASAAGSGMVAAGVALLVARALPAAGAVVSTAVTVLVGGLCLVLFVALTRLLDPGALRLVLRGRALALVPGLGSGPDG